MNFLSGRKGWVIAADACIILLLIAYVVGFTVELRQTSTDNDVQRVVDTIESLQRRSVIYLDDSAEQQGLELLRGTAYRHGGGNARPDIRAEFG